MSDLATFLKAIRRSGVDNTPRLVFADWLDEHYPNVAVRRGEVPTGFNAYWHSTYMYARLGVRGMPRGLGKWSNEDILRGMQVSAWAVGVKWADRVGAAEIGGYPVLISEPRLSQASVLDACASLQWAAEGCPVSFNRCAQRGRLRISIWFTAPPPAGERPSVADVMDRLLAGEELRRPSIVGRVVSGARTS